VLRLRPRDVLKGKRLADVEEVKKKTDGGIKRHHFERVSGLLLKVENMFRPVHCIKWTVLWRRLNL
jgi:hypothetical protein